MWFYFLITIIIFCLIVKFVSFSFDSLNISSFSPLLGPPPRLVTEKEVIARAGTLVTLACNVTSEMPFNVTWHRLVKDTSHQGEEEIYSSCSVRP